jgi:hypothetical protein
LIATGYPMVDRGPDPQVFGILLTSLSRSSLDEKDYVRVSMMVMKTLASGFGSGNYNKDKPLQKGAKRDPSDNFYNIARNGYLLAKSYELVNKKNKGSATPDAGCVLPGMILDLSAFKVGVCIVVWPMGVQCGK